MNAISKACRITVNGSGDWVIDAPGALFLGSEVTSRSLSTSGDLVARRGEFNDNLYCDASLDILGSLKWDGGYLGHLYGLPGDGLHLSLYGGAANECNRNFVVTDFTNRLADHGHNSISVNPTVFIHSVTDPTSDATEYLQLWHDQTDGRIATGKGALVLGAASSVVGLSSNGNLVATHLETTADMYVEDWVNINSTGGLLDRNSYWTLRCGVLDDGLKLCLDDADSAVNHHFIITSYDNRAKDHDHDTPSPNPTLFIHSATDPDTDNAQWSSHFHDQEHAVWQAGKGAMILRSVTTGITASTTQSQGQQYLTSRVNEISTCANAGDVVTMMTATSGLEVIIINNGAQSCDVYPYSSDDLGAGVNTAVALAAGETVHYVAYDSTNWRSI
jgi:hypothetical protein